MSRRAKRRGIRLGVLLDGYERLTLAAMSDDFGLTASATVRRALREMRVRWERRR